MKEKLHNLTEISSNFKDVPKWLFQKYLVDKTQKHENKAAHSESIKSHIVNGMYYNNLEGEPD